MKTLLLVVAILSLPGCLSAMAGEPTYLGTITVSDAGSVNNRTTAVPFAIGGVGTRISIQCPDAGAWVMTSAGQVVAGQGLLMPPTQAILSSIDYNAADAGTYRQGLVAIAPPSGTATAECVILLSR